MTPHFQHLARLLHLEAEAEQQKLRQDIQRQKNLGGGATLTHLFIRDEDFGLGDRYLVTLGPRSQADMLPWSQLGVGSPVVLSEEGTTESNGWRGVISRKDAYTVQVALDKFPESESNRPQWRLDLSPDEITRQRLLAAMNQASSAKGDRLAYLRRVLLGEEPPYFAPAWQQPPIMFLDEALNESQKTAVSFALTAQDLAIIHGPPGTGKTTTLVELIRQAVRRGQTVLACAPSNMAVDNLFEKLLKAGEKVIRLGHPARVMPELRAHTLDELAEVHPNTILAHKLRREAQKTFHQADRFTRAKPAPGEKQALRQEARQLLAEARQLETQAVDQLLSNATILCATTTSLDDKILNHRRFDLCVIDEASQSIEPGCWLPVLYCHTLILAGDPQQLPPTILSIEAARQGLSLSLMERLMSQYGEAVFRQLAVQYRMHHQIMGFSSAEFYGNSLVADSAVSHHLLTDLPSTLATELTTTPLHFIDTAGASYDEETEPDGDSRLNPQEAALVAKKVADLLAAGVIASDIGVIAPYSAQVRLLRPLLPESVEINSVDGFQGREKEVVIISLVRSNPKGEIGFLAEVRRMNVALTRAKRKLIVIGDSSTIVAHPFYSRLLEYIEQTEAYHSVWEEQ